MEITIKSRRGKDLGTLTLKPSNTVWDLKEAFHKMNKKYYPDRQ
jgi:very-long-chain enoyl-CoA reductase